LLEFAALKFCLDEFDPYIYGSPIEIETDCQSTPGLFAKGKDEHTPQQMERVNTRSQHN